MARSLSTNASKNVVIVDGVRIPFTLAGTTYKNDIAVDLARLALKGLITKTAIDPSIIDYVNYGTGIVNVGTNMHNISSTPLIGKQYVQNSYPRAQNVQYCQRSGKKSSFAKFRPSIMNDYHIYNQ